MSWTNSPNTWAWVEEQHLAAVRGMQEANERQQSLLREANSVPLVSLAAESQRAELLRLVRAVSDRPHATNRRRLAELLAVRDVLREALPPYVYCLVTPAVGEVVEPDGIYCQPSLLVALPKQTLEYHLYYNDSGKACWRRRDGSGSLLPLRSDEWRVRWEEYF